MNPSLQNDPSQWRLWPLLWRGLLRGSLLALLWLLLSEGDPESWIIGGPAVVLITAATFVLQPPGRWRLSLTGLLFFVPFFLWRSLVGGVDVAFRSFHPGLPISPSMEKYPLRLPAAGPSRVFFANTVNLLPGTLSAELHEDSVTVHVLSGGEKFLVRLQELEIKVAGLFGQKLHDKT